MPNPYPNASYPKAYDEADFIKSGDAPVNDAGTGLTIEDVAAGSGPLADMEYLTGADVEGASFRGDNVHSMHEVEEEDV